MKIAIGCDHIVTDIKNQMKDYLISKGHDVIDCGTYDNVRTHYPIFGRRVAEKVMSGEVERGVVICGTGVGITVSATKIKGIRSTLTRDVDVVKMARENEDINILGMGGRISGIGLMEELVETFLETDYIATPEKDKKIEYLNSLGDEVIPEEIIFDDLLQKWDDGFYDDGEV